jgi:hypothetical protein
MEVNWNFCLGIRAGAPMPSQLCPRNQAPPSNIFLQHKTVLIDLSPPLGRDNIMKHDFPVSRRGATAGCNATIFRSLEISQDTVCLADMVLDPFYLHNRAANLPIRPWRRVRRRGVARPQQKPSLRPINDHFLFAAIKSSTCWAPRGALPDGRELFRRQVEVCQQLDSLIAPRWHHRFK